MTTATARKALEETTETTAALRSAWDGVAAGYDAFVTPTHWWLGNEGLRRAGLVAGMRFLDVAAGSGGLSIPAARLGADVTATDISPQMLERLAERARQEGLSLETRVMDGHALELPDGSFDVVGSQFGVMLFPDMSRGIKEMARMTRPGGRVLMSVYGDPSKIEFFGFLLRALQSVRPDFTGPPMDPPPLPFQLREPIRLRQELANAGLKGIVVDIVTETLEFHSGAELWDWLIWSNPIVQSILTELALTEEEKSLVRQALDGLVEERSGGRGPALLTNPVNIGVATK